MFLSKIKYNNFFNHFLYAQVNPEYILLGQIMLQAFFHQETTSQNLDHFFTKKRLGKNFP